MRAAKRALLLFVCQACLLGIGFTIGYTARRAARLSAETFAAASVSSVVLSMMYTTLQLNTPGLFSTRKGGHVEEDD